jgi:transcription elongation GreA/GreB family factor
MRLFKLIMREEFEKLVAAGKLESKDIEPLLRLTTSGYCLHRSWGFGKITTVDTVFARFTIDFQDKPGHQMDLGFAADSLKPIDNNHILARKASDLEGLRQMAALNHLDLIHVVLQSFDGKATVDQIQQVLVPDVITEDWKKWWEVAKRELRKSGHFLVPSKKSEPIVYQKQEVSLKDRLLTDFNRSKGLKAKIVAASEVLKNFGDLSNDQTDLITHLLTGLNADITTHHRTQPAVALEAIFIRDDLQSASGLPCPEGQFTTAEIWQQDLALPDMLNQIPLSKHKRTLESFKQFNPEHWHEVVLNAINNLSFKLCQECINLLIHEGKLDLLRQTLIRLINQHQASSDLLLWLAKERSDRFADVLGPEVFRAMLTVMERDQFNERKSNKLHDYILDDQSLVVELIGSADLELIKDLTRALQFSPCFDDMDKRSLLARIVKCYPVVQSLISGEQTRQDNSLLVSWDSLERRRTEYIDLVRRKIPANSREIAVARGYGDLRENHEYKAAKETQKLLLRRKSELESQLHRARGTDFSAARTDVVSVGTKVSLTDLEQSKAENLTILGAWDGDPEKNVISYLTPLAQTLLNHKVGDEIQFQSDDLHLTRLRIDAITAVSSATTGATRAGESPAAPAPVHAPPTADNPPQPSAPAESSPPGPSHPAPKASSADRSDSQ